MLPNPRYLAAGESALVVEFGTTIDPRIYDCVLALDAAIQQANVEGVTETVPTYRSLMIYFDPRRLAAETLVTALAKLEDTSKPARTPPQRWHIPACYDPPHDEDIAEVAAISGFVSRANHRSASGRALSCLYVWFRAGICFSRRASTRTYDLAPGCAPVPGAARIVTDCRRTGADRQLRHADRLVWDRPHAGQSVRSKARKNFSRGHWRRDLFRTDRWRSLRCFEPRRRSRRVFRTLRTPR